MTKRLTNVLHLVITRTLQEALATKAKRLGVRWQDIALTALAREVTREPVESAMEGVDGLPDHVLTELADHIRRVVGEWRGKEDSDG